MERTCAGPSTEAVFTMATSPLYCTAGSWGDSDMRRRKGKRVAPLRQVGHVAFLSNQELMQLAWKWCRSSHPNRDVRSAPSSMGSKQITQGSSLCTEGAFGKAVSRRDGWWVGGLGGNGRANELPAPFSERCRESDEERRDSARPPQKQSYRFSPKHTFLLLSQHCFAFLLPHHSSRSLPPRTVEMIDIGSTLARSDRSAHLAIHVRGHLLLSGGYRSRTCCCCWCCRSSSSWWWWC